MYEKILSKIKLAKIKQTPVLEEVIGVLKKKKSPQSIEEIINSLTSTPNKTTLYRQMAKLKDASIVQETILNDSIRKYCLVNNKHHHHFHCIKCGLVTHLPVKICQTMLSDIKGLPNFTNVEILNHTIELEGQCDKCNH